MAGVIKGDWSKFRWVEICRIAYALGIVSDFSKSETFRLRGIVKQQFAKGTIKQLDRGLYQLRKTDVTEWVQEEPTDDDVSNTA